MYMKIKITSDQFGKLKGSIKHTGALPKKDSTAKFIKCEGCKKFFTQTFHKKKKSLPICPWCGKHNTTHGEEEIDERSRSFAFTRKKRLFSKAEMMANPMRYKEFEKELKEMDTYKFSETPDTKASGENDYKEVLSNYTFIKEVGDFAYFYDVKEEHGNGTPIVTIYVVNHKNKEQVGVAEFELRMGEDFFVAFPYVRKEYRNLGIAMEIYKILLTFGNIVSGKAQSQQAVGLWKKLFRELPNEMVFVDDNGEEHDVQQRGDELIVGGDGKSVYDIKGGYLKLYKD